MTYYIYAIENRLNGLTYVGKTYNVDKRWKNHLKPSKRNKTKLAKDIRELGWIAFSIRVLDIANTSAEACNKERLYIHLLEANDPKFGYNNPSIYSWKSAIREADIELAGRLWDSKIAA